MRVSRSSPITVMHVISGDLWAGAEAMAYQLLSGLKKAWDIDLHLVIMNKGRLEQLCRHLDIKCYLIDERKFSSSAIVSKTILIARKIKPDIIHSHRYKENILAAIMAGFCGRPKLVATQHGRTESDKARVNKSIIDKINQVCLRWIFSKAVAVSKDTADYLLQEYGLKRSKISIIPNGIEVHLSSRPQGDKRLDHPFIIGSAGRLFPVKQFDIFVEIARKVCRVKSQTRFVIAGEGPERQKLISLIAQYGLGGQVQLLGHVEDMQVFYNGLDLYINTSMHEGMPMSILEAMAIGLPVIAFDVAGLKEIVTDSVDGFTIPEGDTILFASRIVELINNSKYLNDLGKNARQKIVDHFSTTKMVEGYRALYRRTLRMV